MCIAHPFRISTSPRGFYCIWPLFFSPWCRNTEGLSVVFLLCGHINSFFTANTSWSPTSRRTYQPAVVSVVLVSDAAGLVSQPRPTLGAHIHEYVVKVAAERTPIPSSRLQWPTNRTRNIAIARQELFVLLNAYYSANKSHKDHPYI